ncbi:MAG: hypothetical protein O3B84_02610 [Chloroflexi bacterium]|nr:hypothetical protein [Chloroflexota bacterium]
MRYLVYRSISISWWERLATSYLNNKGWRVIRPEDFSYDSSYGVGSNISQAPIAISTFKYLLSNASAVVEYHGHPTEDSVFEPGHDRTLIDDLLRFMSLYTGTYWQYLWKEHRDESGQWKGFRAAQMTYDGNNTIWAGPRDLTPFFERALEAIPALDETQFQLATKWFFSALREFEGCRPLVEAAFNWVILESQANYLGFKGTKKQRVEKLLDRQRFPRVSGLEDTYRLRNDAFHDGQLSNLSEARAQEVRNGIRALARAQILNLIGMRISEFDKEFVGQYEF